MDAHKNLATSTVATAPSPADSGTSLVVAAAHGGRFPAPPFDLSISPNGAYPDPANTEIARCTNVATDTLTITRAQYGTSARSVVAGDRVTAAITSQTLDELASVPSIHNITVGEWLTPPTASLTTGTALTFEILFVIPLWVPEDMNFDRITFEITGNGGAGSVTRLGYYLPGSGNGGVGALGEDFGTIQTATGAQGLKSITINLSLTRGWYYLAAVAQVGTAPSVRKSTYVLNRESTKLWATPNISPTTVLGQAGVTGALPETFTATTGQSTGVTMGLRVAS